jgi:ATP-binding cassette subfamily F protein 3
MLTEYDGTVAFVSHDRFFIDRVATRVWDIINEGLVQYLGNFSDAARQKSKLSGLELAAERQKPAPVAEAPAQRPPTRRSGSPSESRLQKQLASTEREISRLEERLNQLSDAIAIAGVDGQRERLEQLSVEYAEAERELDGAYHFWEELNGQLESLAVAAPVG